MIAKASSSVKEHAAQAEITVRVRALAILIKYESSF